jgi:WD40 repeat protein
VTGACDLVIKGHSNPVLALEGHTWPVHALAVCGTCGSRLASGSEDRSIKVWAMGGAGPWTYERTLLGHGSGVCSLAEWQGKLLSGSKDGTIRMWDVGTGVLDSTHSSFGEAFSLAVHGDRLFSASTRGTIRVWALGTWVALRTVEGLKQYPRCLALSGSQLVSGSCAYSYSSRGLQPEVRVWNLETLELQYTLPQPAGANVGALLAVAGGVWAGVGNDVVVWGRGA